MLHDMFVLGIPLAEKMIRTLGVYVFLLAGLRLAGKRELGQFNPFDLVVLLLLSNTVQNAIIGNDNSLLGGIAGATTLLVINAIVVRYIFGHPRVARWLEGDADVLIQDGELQQARLKRELITHEELESAARKQGIDGLDKVEMCRLEVGGALTFVARSPTDDERNHNELIRRLDELGRSQAALLERMSALDRKTTE